jgi:hypothetical protein
MRLPLIALSTAALLACGPPTSSNSGGSRRGGSGSASDAGAGGSLDASAPTGDAGSDTADAGTEPGGSTIEQTCDQLATIIRPQCPDQVEGVRAWCLVEYATLSAPGNNTAGCFEAFATTCDLDALRDCVGSG